MQSWVILTATSQNRHRRSWPGVLASVLACLAADFLLPYALPARLGPSVSAMAGFSNTALLASVLLTTVAFGWYMRGYALDLPLRVGANEGRCIRGVLAAASVCVTVVCLLLWLAQRTKGGVGELTFFGPLYENYRLGQRFYRDLDFPYGPLLAYSPVLASRLSGLSLFDGYHLAWLFQSLLGLYLLYQTVALLGIATPPRARAVFLLVAAFFYVQLYSEGIQYTPTRFLMAPLLALFTERQYRNGTPLWKVFLLAALGNAVILFYSPEQGIQFFLGTLLFFLLCVRRARRPGTWAGLGLFTLLVTAAFAAAASIGILGFLFRTSGGALNLPLLLGLPTLVLILFLLAAGVLASAAGQQHRLDHPWVYLIALSLITLPVACSRCDPGHIVVNVIGAVLAVFVALSGVRMHFRVACTAFLLVIGRDLVSTSVRVLPAAARDGLRQAVTEPTPLHGLARRYNAYLVRHRGPAAAAAMQREHTAVAPMQPGIALPPGTVFSAPFGAPYTLPRPTSDPHILTGSYPGLGIYAEYDEAEKRRDLRNHPDRLVLLPDDWRQQCRSTAATTAEIRRSLGWLFQTPLVPQLAQRSPAWQPFCLWVAATYRETAYASPLPNMRVYRRISPQ